MRAVPYDTPQFPNGLLVLAGARTGFPYANRAAFLDATIAAPIYRAGYLTAYGVLMFIRDAAGTAATTTADGQKWSPDGEPSCQHWGAGLGTSSATNDDAAMTAAFAWTTPLLKTLRLDGNIYIHDQVPIPGAPRMVGGPQHSLIHVSGPNKAMFRSTISANNGLFDIQNVRATSNTLTVNTLNAFLEFVGVISWTVGGKASNNTFDNFYNVFVTNIDGRTTASGLEGGVNWSRFENNDYRNVFRAHWIKQGTGTGNVFLAETPRIRIGGSYMHVDPIAVGYVAGDVMIGFAHGNGISGQATFLKIAAGSVYGAQWSLVGNQFDADMTIPIVLPTDFEFVNFVLVGNNWGGASALGANLQPLGASVITDRSVSRWESGVQKNSNTIGAITLDLFDIDFGTIKANQTVKIEVKSSCNVGSVGARVSSATFFIETDGTTMAITEITQDRSGSTSRVTITVASISGTKARVSLGFTSAGAGSTSANTIHGSGGPAFKITRL